MTHGRKMMRLAVRLLVLVLGLALLCSVPLTAGAADDMPSVRMRLQAAYPGPQAKRMLSKFLELVKERSGGKMKIQVFPVGALVPPKEILFALGDGTIELALFPEGYWHQTIPVSKLGQGAPFVFENFDQVKTFMLKKGFGDLLKEAYAEHKVYHMPYEPYCSGLITKEPVKSVADLKGRKLRAYGIMGEWLIKLGATTAFVPGGELYTSLATGVVDGATWGDAGPMFELKLHEVCKNYMKPEPIMGAWNILGANLKVWKSLTPKQREVIESSVADGGLNWSFNDTRALSKKALDEMVSKWKVQVVELPKAEQEKMAKAGQEVLADLAKSDARAAKAVELLNKYMAEIKK